MLVISTGNMGEHCISFGILVYGGINNIHLVTIFQAHLVMEDLPMKLLKMPYYEIQTHWLILLNTNPARQKYATS